MRVAVLAVLLTAGLLFAALGWRDGRSQVFAQPPTSQRSVAFDPTGQLIALTSDVAQQHQQVAVIDPRARVMSVYHISREDGKISLMSVRNISWDLRMDEFNGAKPSPQEIRSLLEQR